MFFVYASLVFTGTMSYEVHIYKMEQYLFPVGGRVKSRDVNEIVEFLKKYHNGLFDKDKLTVNLKIKIRTEGSLEDMNSSDSHKIEQIINSLDFYKLKQVAIISVGKESPSKTKLKLNY